MASIAKKTYPEYASEFQRRKVRDKQPVNRQTNNTLKTVSRSYSVGFNTRISKIYEENDVVDARKIIQ